MILLFRRDRSFASCYNINRKLSALLLYRHIGSLSRVNRNFMNNKRGVFNDVRRKGKTAPARTIPFSERAG